MKKVLFVATVVKLHIMVFHVKYLEWFHKNGYEVHVCARNDYENREDCRIPYCDKFYDLPFERSPFKHNNLKVFKELKHIIDINNYEIIHCHTPIGGALTRFAARNARCKGSKVIYTAHGFHFFKGAPIINWLIYYPIEKWLARYTDVLVTINKEDYKRACRFKARQVKYVPGVGLDLTKFTGLKVTRKLKRIEIGIPENAQLIVSVGELNKNKNHEVIIRALAKIRSKKINYILCGKGKRENFLRELSNHLGVNDKIHFLGYRNDIPEILKAADLFAYPSHREGLPLSLMEAMASGLPVICSNIRGNSDLIQDGYNGYLVLPNDVNKFAECISNFFSKDLYEFQMGKKNIINVKKYSEETVLDKYGEIIKTLERGDY